MDATIQELEFLSFDGLDEDEKCVLKNFLYTERQCESPPEGPVEDVTRAAYEDVGNHQFVVPGSVGYPSSHPPMPPIYPANMCMTTIPQFQQPQQQPAMMTYPHVPTMFTGAALMGPPSYYLNSIAAQPPFAPHAHRIVNPLAYKRSNKPYRSKTSPRKDIPNGHPPDNYVYQPSTYAGPFIPGSFVQAATGMPIVMHQPVPSHYVPHQVASPSPVQPYPTSINSLAHHSPPPNSAAALPHHPAEAPVVNEVVVDNVQRLASPKPPVEEAQPAQINEVVEEKLDQVEVAPAVVEKPATPPPAVVAKEVEPISTPIASHVKEPEQSSPAKPQESPADSSTTKSWASLFKKDPQPDKPTSRIEPITSPAPTPVDAAEDKAVSAPAASNSSAAARPKATDVRTRRLAERLASYELQMAPLALLPRGLINKSNWCYVNATLQALIACPPFVHLFKSLASFVAAGKGGEESATPIIDSVIDFVEQFEVVAVRTSHKERASAKKEEPHFGTNFEPSSIYRMLSKVRSETFKVEGRQEDAEEFLCCLLNGLHDEMIEVLKTVRNGTVAPEQAKSATADEEDWLVIGPKNRGCVTHTTSYSKTPVSNLFLGLMRSAVQYVGAQTTATLQPFFSLQLDIQSEQVNSVRDALACLVTKEPLTGYACPKTGQVVEASRQTTLEELPPILILHLKCFVYDKSGGCQKLLKRIDFSSDLELSKDFLSPNQKGKLKERQRHYKLFAVVYHDGKEATKGHYVTEVHHSGTGGWLRFDDSIIRVVDTQPFKYSLPRMPYLLLYRKVNL